MKLNLCCISFHLQVPRYLDLFLWKFQWKCYASSSLILHVLLLFEQPLLHGASISPLRLLCNQCNHQGFIRLGSFTAFWEHWRSTSWLKYVADALARNASVLVEISAILKWSNYRHSEALVAIQIVAVQNIVADAKLCTISCIWMKFVHGKHVWDKKLLLHFRFWQQFTCDISEIDSIQQTELTFFYSSLAACTHNKSIHVQI